jgi:hypothetical protein
MPSGPKALIESTTRVPPGYHQGFARVTDLTEAGNAEGWGWMVKPIVGTAGLAQVRCGKAIADECNMPREVAPGICRSRET